MLKTIIKCIINPQSQCAEKCRHFDAKNWVPIFSLLFFFFARYSLMALNDIVVVAIGRKKVRRNVFVRLQLHSLFYMDILYLTAYI